MRTLVTLGALLGVLRLPSATAAPPGRIWVDLYSPETRQLVRYVSPLPRSPLGAGGVPGLLGAQLGAPGEVVWAPPASRIDRPGRSPADIERLAAGGDNLKVTGTWRALCLLVDFSDHPPRRHGGPAGVTHFRDLLYSENAAQPRSLRDYLREVSYARFLIGGVVSGGAAGWYRAPSPYASYTHGASGEGAYPNNSQKLVEEVVDLADPDVDYADYDNDRDGYVDALLIVHSGPASQNVPAAQKPNHLATHKWEIADRRRDNRTISVYALQAETEGMGAFAHEFGHVLGLPDLYDPDETSRGVGFWSLMGDGCALGNPPESRPCHPDAWCKHRLGWLTPTVVRGQQAGVVVPPVETNATAYALWKDGSPGRQYFLVENRQRTGFDGLLPGSGLCIWHVDEGKFALENTQEWWPGKPTGDGQHYLVALEQADGAWHLEHKTNRGNAGDLFPGTGGNRLFDATSTPNSQSYGTGETQVRVANISNPNAEGKITADLEAGASDLVPPTDVVISPDRPDPTDNLTVVASGGQDSGAGAVEYEYTWWVSIDGGQTYTRQVQVTGNLLSHRRTWPWQMWQARARTKSGERYSDWTASSPVTIIPGVDPAGHAIRATWFAHQHPRPPKWTDAQWHDHYYHSNGRSWRTAFHSLFNARADVHDGDMIIFGPGTYSAGENEPFSGVSLTSTAPQNPAVRASTIVSPIRVAGTRCVATGLTLWLRSSAPTTVEQCLGEVTWTPASDAALDVRDFQGVLRATTAAGKQAEIEVRRSALTGLTVEGSYSGGATVTVADSTFTGEARVDVKTQSPAIAAVTFTGSTFTKAALKITVGGAPGRITVTDNTVTQGYVTCVANPKALGRFLRNKITGAANVSPAIWGLRCVGLAPLTVSKNEITGVSGRGLELVDCGTPVWKARISENVITGNGGGGVQVGGGGANSYANIHDNRISGNTNTTGDYPKGGGLFLCLGAATVTENDIGHNKAVDGGGIYNGGCLSAVRSNWIVFNTATEQGGGVFLGCPDAVYEGNRIQGNTARNGGGTFICSGVLKGNTVAHSEAQEGGGGVFLAFSSPYGVYHSVTNNVIARNEAAKGGGVCFGDNPWASEGSLGILDGNTLHLNKAAHGGGIYASTQSVSTTPFRALVRNCIVTDSTGGGLEEGRGARLEPSYNDVFSNTGGDYVHLPSQTGRNGNLSVSPRYVNPAMDYHLKSEAGHWNASTKRWVKDGVTSPCIDAGAPTSPYGNEPEPNGDRVNMGACGNTAEASKSFVSMMTDHSPESDATGVATTAVIRITFRWNLYQDSVRPRFSLTPAHGDPVAGTFQWPLAGQKMVFRPSAPLRPNTEYTVELAKGIRRLSDAVIDWSEKYSFTTRATAAAGPAVRATGVRTPNGGAAIAVSLSATAAVGATIRNLAGRVVAALPERELPMGLSTLLWDGRSLSRVRVPDGRYLVEVTARAADGRRTRALTTLSLRR